METKRKVRLDLFTAKPWEEGRDYQAEINAINSKANKTADDYKQMAALEQSRNAKIADLNAAGTNTYGATATNNYAGWLDDTDYSAKINEGIMSGNADWRTVQGLLDARTNKQNTAAGMKELWGDPSYDTAVQRWIDQQKSNEQFQMMSQQYQSQIESLYDALYSMPQIQVPDYSELLAQLGNYKAPTYEDRWDDVKQKLANAALNMNYDDWLGSTQYEQLAKRYGMYGDQAMRDTLGQMASRTGGLASSYAQTAAQQSYNDYMAQLEQAAYDMYRNEQSDALEKAQAAFGYSDNDYQRYLDDLAQYNTDRGFGFDVISKAIDQSNYANEWAYRQQQAALERADALRNQEYQRAMDERNWQYQMSQDEYKRDAAARADAEDRAKVLAGYGDFSGYSALGYSDDEIARMQAAYEMANAPKASSSSGGSSRSSGSGSSSGGAEDYDGLFAAAAKATSPHNYISAHYKEHGFKTSSGLWDAFQDWQNGQSNAGGDDDILLYNQEGPEGVDIPGHGNYSWTELTELENEGKVRETFVTIGGKKYRKIEATGSWK